MVPLNSGTCSRVRATWEDTLTPAAMQAIQTSIIDTQRLDETVKKNVKTPLSSAAADDIFFLPNLVTSLPLMSAPTAYKRAAKIKRYVANPFETAKCCL
jgi:hypothetical protein